MRIIAALLILLLVTPAVAQTGQSKTAVQLNQEVATSLASGQSPPITAAALRQILLDIIASELGPNTGVTAPPNTVLAGPAVSGQSAVPTFRALVAADIPNFSVTGANIRSITDFGAVCNGTIDDTAAIQDAITTQVTANAALFFPSGTCMVSTVTVPSQGLSLVGSGPQSIIKQIAGTNEDLINVTDNSVNLSLSALTIDGNWQNQTNDVTHQYNSVDFRSNSVGDARASLSIYNCIFKNGRARDINVRVVDAVDPMVVYVDIRDSKFLGGVEGTATFASGYISTAGTVITHIVNNTIDFNAFGAVPIEHGRMGLQLTALSTNPALDLNHSRQLVMGNIIRYTGRSTDNVSLGVIGSIDLYTGNMDSVIANNRLEQPYGRGITVKANESNISITGNVVRGLHALHGPATIASQINVLGSTNINVGHGVVISGNAVTDSDNHGITVDRGIPLGGAGSTSSIVGNVIRNTVGRGVWIKRTSGALVANNVIDRAGIGIFANDAFSPAQITGNTITNSGTISISIVSEESLDATGPVGLLGAITAGSGYTAGVSAYRDVPLTGGTGTLATANIIVTGDAVTSVQISNRGDNYTVGDVLTASAADIGGTGSGFSIPISTIYAANFMISNNVIETPGSYGIYAQYITGATIVGNQIMNMLFHNPIAIQNTTGPVLVKNNNLTGSLPVLNGGNNANLWAVDNNTESFLTFSGLLVAPSGDSVLAWTDSIVINNTASSQTLKYINGVADGAVIVVMQSSNANTVTLERAVGADGNMGMDSNAVLTDTASRIIFKKTKGVLFEIARIL